jgi:RNA polymerase sigma-70 factor (ECF subfamily)
MPPPVGDSRIERLLARSRQGDAAALGELLQDHRPYLKLLARRFLRGRLAVRLDESDAVQQTCLSAFRNFAQFRGTRAREFVAWLKRIHEANLHNALRDQAAARRSVDREQPLPANPLRDEQAATATQRALRDERAVLLAQALEKLPEAQAEAVRLRHLEGLSLADMAAAMQRSEQSVVGLLRRGIDGLRTQLRRHVEGSDE